VALAHHKGIIYDESMLFDGFCAPFLRIRWYFVPNSGAISITLPCYLYELAWLFAAVSNAISMS
jgi:hypothetical protein